MNFQEIVKLNENIIKIIIIGNVSKLFINKSDNYQ